MSPVVVINKIQAPDGAALAFWSVQDHWRVVTVRVQFKASS